MIFHSGSTILSICWYVLISGGFSLDLSQLLVSTLHSFDISPFSFLLLTLADLYYKRHWQQPILPTREPFMWSAFWCQVHEAAFLLNLKATSLWKWPTLFTGAILLLPPCLSCTGCCLSFLSLLEPAELEAFGKPQLLVAVSGFRG